MSYEPRVPTLSDLAAQGAGGQLEFICQNPVCRHQALRLGDDFPQTETVKTLAAKARCSKCGGKNVLVFPRWIAGREYGLPTRN